MFGLILDALSKPVGELHFDHGADGFFCLQVGLKLPSKPRADNTPCRKLKGAAEADGASLGRLKPGSKLLFVSRSDGFGAEPGML